MAAPDAQLAPSLGALAALRRAEDPREVLLDELLTRSGARLAVWVPAGDGLGRLVRRGGGGPRACPGELPAHLPWPALLELSPGSSRRFDSRWLGRWPGPRALGLSEALAG
ncbi:hypothetical protein DRQ53_14250, partial [bacterium]